jgi:enamine deaminase RidA (YjgF/YER057c/UK114 family)
MKTERRSALKKMFASVVGLAGLGIGAKASVEKITGEVINFQDVPLFSRSTTYGDLVFLSGMGGNGSEPHTIENDTKAALDSIEEELNKVGSSMGHVLQASVYMEEIGSRTGMEAAYRGRFAPAPARSSAVVQQGGIPDNSLVAIDCVAYIPKDGEAGDTRAPNGRRYGNLLFISGRGGYGSEPFTIENHTTIALDSIQEELAKVGSSMGHVLQASVYMEEIGSRPGMETAYRGRFAPAPARSSAVVQQGGIPEDSLVEIDCVAYIPKDGETEPPRVPSGRRHGNLLFMSGRGGYGSEPFTIEKHTDHCLNLIEESLIAAGSSMEKVLKVNVMLDDIANYDGLNTAYKGRFGANPPARTTAAVQKGGISGNSLLILDCIAYV